LLINKLIGSKDIYPTYNLQVQGIFMGKFFKVHHSTWAKENILAESWEPNLIGDGGDMNLSGGIALITKPQIAQQGGIHYPSPKA
jgi:hypothetical protein